MNQIAQKSSDKSYGPSSRILLEYDSVIKEQERLGIIEKVELGEDKPPGDKIHYLPHQAVMRQDKETTKVRVVNDASAGSNGPSLNDCFILVQSSTRGYLIYC